MRVGVLLSVREKASRLPGKVIADICGFNVTEHLINRLKLASLPKEVVIATSDDPRDSVFDEIGTKLNVNVFHGSQDDKLLRYRDAAEAYNFDYVIIVDGDDLLCFPEFIDKLILKAQSQRELDAVFCKELPLGAASSLLSKASLDRVVDLKAQNDTEVWGGYYIDSGYFNVGYITAEEPFNRPNIRMTLDYEEDLDFFRAVFEELFPKNEKFSSSDVMDLLINQRPNLCKINLSAQEKYEQHIGSATPVMFKKEENEL